MNPVEARLRMLDGYAASLLHYSIQEDDRAGRVLASVVLSALKLAELAPEGYESVLLEAGARLDYVSSNTELRTCCTNARAANVIDLAAAKARLADRSRGERRRQP